MKEILIFCSVLSLIYAIKLKSFHFYLRYELLNPRMEQVQNWSTPIF